MCIVIRITPVILCILATTCFADDETSKRLWQCGQFKQRGKIAWQMPTINIKLPQQGQIGLLPLQNAAKSIAYVIIDVVDEWTVLVGASIPSGGIGDIVGASVGDVQSAGRNNLMVNSPKKIDIDVRFICRMPTSGRADQQRFFPTQLFQVSGLSEKRGDPLLELELVYAPYQRQALTFVNSQLRENRLWTDATGSFKVSAKYVDGDEQVQLRKLDGKDIELDVQKLSPSDLNYISREKEKLSTLLKVVAAPITGFVQDDVYPHVYGFESLKQLEAYWASKAVDPELTAGARKQAGITLIPSRTSIEVRRTHRLTEDAVSIEISPTVGELEGKVLYITSFDFVSK